MTWLRSFKTPRTFCSLSRRIFSKESGVAKVKKSSSLTALEFEDAMAANKKVIVGLSDTHVVEDNISNPVR